jgi:TRAP-type C4-dicarboxylate transport system permease small subunit
MMMSGLRRLALVFALAGVASAALVALMVVTSVSARALIGRPIPGDVELTQFGVALCISLCLPWCQLRGANIVVDFFTQRLPVARIRVLDAMGTALVALMCALLAWRTGVGALAVREAQETTMILELPMWWAYASLAPGLALAAAIAALQTVLLLGGRSMASLQGDGAS